VELAKRESGQKTSEQALTRDVRFNIGKLANDLERRRDADSLAWPLLRLLDPRLGKQWILFCDETCPWLQDIRCIANCVRKTCRYVRRKGKLSRKPAYRSMPRPHLFELYLLEYLWEKPYTETFEATLVQRMDILTKASSVFPMKDGADWRLLEQDAVDLLAAPLKGRQPQDAVDLLPAPLTGMHPHVVLEKLRARTQGLIAPIGQHCEPGAPFVPRLPAHYVARPDLMRSLGDIILSRSENTPLCAVTGLTAGVGIHGMGGIGKTVIATALVDSPAVRRRFGKRIVWLTLGQYPDLMERQREAAVQLGQSTFYCKDLQHGRAQLARLLQKGPTLLILDDVWKIEHLEAFDIVRDDSRLLLTTRDNSLVAGTGAKSLCVDVFSRLDALELLAKWSGHKIVDLPVEADAIVEECGRLPLALAMVGAQLRSGVVSWANVLHKLRHTELEELGQKLIGYPYPSLIKAIHASVEALPGDVPKLYSDLAVFREDCRIPLGALQTLWSERGISALRTEYVLNLLVQRSLLFYSDDGRFYLHDLQLDYLRNMAEDLPALHQTMVDAYAKRCSAKWATGSNDGYYFENLIHHMRSAGMVREARQTLLSPAWLQAKLANTSINNLIDDYEELISDSKCRIVQEALRLSAHVLAKDARQLPGQLAGRLMHLKAKWVNRFISEIAGNISGKPWLRPLVPSLPSPGGAHVQTINGAGIRVVLSHDGRTIIATDGHTTRLWDLCTGKQILANHNLAQVLAISPNGRYIATGSGSLVQVWLTDGKTLVFKLPGQQSMILDLAFTHDSRYLVSCSSSRQILKWNLENGKVVWRSSKHQAAVNALCVSQDGHLLVTGSDDKTVGLWDLDAGRLVKRLEGHASAIESVAASNDGCVICSGSRDGRIRFWNVQNGNVIDEQVAAPDKIGAFRLIRDNELIAGCGNDVVIWDMALHKRVRTLGSHNSTVRSIATSPDGRLVITASLDGIIKTWDLSRAPGNSKNLATPPKIDALYKVPHGKYVLAKGDDGKAYRLITPGRIRCIPKMTDTIENITVATDGDKAAILTEEGHVKVFSLPAHRLCREMQFCHRPYRAIGLSPTFDAAAGASFDGAWNICVSANCHSPHWRRCHGKLISLLVFVDEDRVASASEDRTVKLWAFPQGKLIHCFKGHSRPVSHIFIRPDREYMTSVGGDRTVRVWSLKSYELVRVYSWSRGSVSSATLTFDGEHLALGSTDNSVRIYGMDRSGEPIELSGHTDRVTGLSFLNEGNRLASCSWDGSVRVWDWRSGKEIACFYADSRLIDCAFFWDTGTIVALEEGGSVHWLALQNCSTPRPRRRAANRIDGHS